MNHTKAAIVPKHGLKYKENRAGWLFISCCTILIIIFVFVPMFQALYTSLFTGTGVNFRFNGLGNYRRMLSDYRFQTAAKNTVFYLLMQVPIMLVTAVVTAVILNSKWIRGKSFFRTLIFLPCITSLVAYSVVMKSLFTTEGLINNMLLAIHLIGQPIQWFSDPVWAKVMIIFSITWRWTGYNMIFYLSGLQNIDPSIYEASDIDGAGALTKFFRITMPLLKPIVLFTTITSVNGTLQLFDEIKNMTYGGPAGATSTIAYYIYGSSFGTGAVGSGSIDIGYAAAMSMVILVAVVILTAIQLYVGGDRKDA